MQKEDEKLKPLVDKLSLSSDKLELLLSNQRFSSNRAEIICNSNSNLVERKISAQNKFQKSNVVCFCCKRVGHKAYLCNFRKKKKNNVKKVWVPKGTTCTNSNGPKKIWVPKIST